MAFNTSNHIEPRRTTSSQQKQAKPHGPYASLQSDLCHNARQVEGESSDIYDSTCIAGAKCDSTRHSYQAASCSRNFSSQCVILHQSTKVFSELTIKMPDSALDWQPNLPYAGLMATALDPLTPSLFRKGRGAHACTK
jgi:hypothetical protein